MLTVQFLRDFKRATEEKWSVATIAPHIYGFQFQRGTRWNPGLSDEQISDYERTVEAQFPHDFRAFLREMNGTDLPTINIYGSSGEPVRYRFGVYSYPRDLTAVMELSEEVRANRDAIVADLRSQGFELPADAVLVPVFSHRYLVCSSDLAASVILSVVTNDVDAIVYANSLEQWLPKEFLEASL